jgi:uncharacterized protein YgiM (DUF1202 family)
MSARSMALVSALSLSLVAPAVLFAQDASVKQEQVDNSKVAFAGVINTDNVYVRSGPSENYYPTQKLSKGDKVTVVGIKFDWLKIVPPEGSFCYVAKSYVEKTGEGTGKVSRPSINVRAGSSLNPQKGTIQMQLQEGDPVSIIGEQDEYYKIKPPAGSFVFVNKQYVDPVRELAQGEAPVLPTPRSPTPRTPETSVRVSGNETTPTTPGAEPGTATVESTPAPSPAVAPAATETAAQTQAETDYDKAETDFTAASAQPLESQPLSDLVSRYTALTSNDNLPVTLRRNAESRLRALKSRLDAQNEILAVKKLREESNERIARLKAEQDAINQRLAGTSMRLFTAVGNLESSTLEQNGAPLYRLTDPGTGHTVVYVKSDNSLPAKVGTFVGVKGDVLSDQTLGVKVITPKSVEDVDPTAVGKTVTAEMMPPSLLPKTAATGQ